MRNTLLTAAVAVTATIGLAFGAAAQQKPAAKPAAITVYKTPT